MEVCTLWCPKRFIEAYCKSSGYFSKTKSKKSIKPSKATNQNKMGITTRTMKHKDTTKYPAI